MFRHHGVIFRELLNYFTKTLSLYCKPLLAFHPFLIIYTIVWTVIKELKKNIYKSIKEFQKDPLNQYQYGSNIMKGRSTEFHTILKVNTKMY